jgi:hypothetical protein
VLLDQRRSVGAAQVRGRRHAQPRAAERVANKLCGRGAAGGVGAPGAGGRGGQARAARASQRLLAPLKRRGPCAGGSSRCSRGSFRPRPLCASRAGSRASSAGCRASSARRAPRPYHTARGAAPDSVVERLP